MSKIVTGVPFEAPPVAALPIERRKFPRDPEFGRRVFDIRVADNGGQRSAAGILIDRMYATRGYLSSGLPNQSVDNRITLVASEAETTIGTITMGFDAGDGLMVDDLFGPECEALRDQGESLCEFTKLAIDGAVRSRRVIASLFHAAYIYALPVKGADRLLIEVNPRHVAYYKRMLGFDALTGVRINRRVDAPAVLMALDLAHARAQIARFGGLAEAAPLDERSLYPYFFAPQEECAIVERVLAQRPSYAPPAAPKMSRPAAPAHPTRALHA